MIFQAYFFIFFKTVAIKVILFFMVSTTDQLSHLLSLIVQCSFLIQVLINALTIDKLFTIYCKHFVYKFKLPQSTYIFVQSYLTLIKNQIKLFFIKNFNEIKQEISSMMKPKIKSNTKNNSISSCVNQILSFLQNYQIENIDQRTMVIRTLNTNHNSQKTQILEFLIKNTTVQTHQIKDIEKILNTHLTFSKDYLLCLIDYQVTNDLPSNETNMSFSNIQTEPKQIIKAVYEYSSKSLLSDFLIRQNQNYFYQQNDLWKVITVLVHGLNYLQEKGVIYGVLGFQRIHFLSDSDGQDWKIKLLDPSATAMDPLQIMPDRHYSPQLLFKYLNPTQIMQSESQRQKNLIESQAKTIVQNQQQLDMFKSDVYVMGLLILQLGLLQQIKPITKFQDPCSSTQTTEENYFFYYKDHFRKIKFSLEKFSQLYSKQLTNLVSVLLAENPFDRPSFPELLQYLLNLQLEISAISQAIIKNNVEIISTPLPNDSQDRPSAQVNQFEQNLEIQEPDKMKQEDSIIVGRVQQEIYQNKSSKSDFQRAKQTFNLTNKKLQSGSKNNQKLQQSLSANDYIYESSTKANKKSSAKKNKNQQYYKTSHTRTHSQNGSNSYEDKNNQSLNFSNKRMIKKSRKISNQQQNFKNYCLEKVEENILDLQEQQQVLDKQSFKQVLNQLNHGLYQKQMKNTLTNSNCNILSNKDRKNHQMSELRKTLQMNKISSKIEEQDLEQCYPHQQTKSKNKNKAKIIKQKVREAISKELPLMQSKSRPRNQSNHSQSSKQEYLSAYSRNSQNTNSMNQSKSTYRYKQQQAQDQYYIKPYTNSEKFQKCNGLFTDPKLLRQIRQERTKGTLPGAFKNMQQSQQAKHILFR